MGLKDLSYEVDAGAFNASSAFGDLVIRLKCSCYSAINNNNIYIYFLF